jgi:hypothetical protein
MYMINEFRTISIHTMPVIIAAYWFWSCSSGWAEKKASRPKINSDGFRNRQNSISILKNMNPFRVKVGKKWRAVMTEDNSQIVRIVIHIKYRACGIITHSGERDK